MSVARAPEPAPSGDRKPPQQVEAERAVLGAMLLNPDAVGPAIEILRDRPEETFYVRAHQLIYSAVLAILKRNEVVDVLTLNAQLERDGQLDHAGGTAYLAELSGAVATSANVEYYAKLVLDAALLRRIISTCTRVASEAYNPTDEVTTLLDKAESEIFSIAEQRQTNPIWQVGELLHDGINRIEEQMRAQTGITGLASGFKDLDELLSGFQPSDMVILAARPSVGKTALALNVATHASLKLNQGVLLFSLEMSKEQLVQRVLCMVGQINTKKLRQGFMATHEFAKVQHAADQLHTAPLFIEDTPNISVLELRSKARRHAANKPCDLIIIDYLQRMRGIGRSESRQVEIAEISRSIKGIARELRVPVIALSQLSREAEKDDAGMPKLSHLRESGAIEQDADVVMMLSRPPAHEAEGNENMIKLNVAKQRNGPTGIVSLLFEKDIQRFRDLAHGHGASHTNALPPPDDYDPEFDAPPPPDGDADIPF